MDRSLEEMLSEYRYERKPQEPILAVKWAGDNLEEVRKIYPGLSEDYMRDKGCGLGFYVVVSAPGFVRFWYGPDFEERYQRATLSVQGEEFPGRPKPRKVTPSGGAFPMDYYDPRPVEDHFAALEAEIRRLKGERDAAYQETALSGNRLGERYEAYCETNPKPMMTFSGWLNKRIGDAEAAEQALSASRADALKEAAAEICGYCKYRPETPPENRDGIWFHPEMSPRADGTEFDNSPTCKAQAILARMEKAS